MAGSSGIADAQYRDLYFYSLYRVLEAGLLALLLFGPIRELLPKPRLPMLGKLTSVAYLVAAGGLMYWAMRQVALRWQVVIGIGIDLLVGLLAIQDRKSTRLNSSH